MNQQKMLNIAPMRNRTARKQGFWDSIGAGIISANLNN
jgi:hypothetical protein